MADRERGTDRHLRGYIGGATVVGFAFLFAIVGVLNVQILLLLLAAFIDGAATTESRTVLFDGLLEGFTVDDIMTRDPETVPADTTVEAFGDRLLRDRQAVHLVTDESGAVIGVVALEDLTAVTEGARATSSASSLSRITPTA